jgi:hypothetical protein
MNKVFYPDECEHTSVPRYRLVCRDMLDSEIGIALAYQQEKNETGVRPSQRRGIQAFEKSVGRSTHGREV